MHPSSSYTVEKEEADGRMDETKVEDSRDELYRMLLRGGSKAEVEEFT